MGSVLLSADKPRDIWDEHEAMINLVVAGDAVKAEEAARRHLEQAANFMIERLRDQLDSENAAWLLPIQTSLQMPQVAPEAILF